MADHVARAQTQIAAPPKEVWSALTDPAAVKAYMFGAVVDTDWEVGSPITWTGEYDGRPYQDKGEIVRFDEPERLTLTHYSPMGGQPDEPENYHHLDYRLASEGDGTSITLEQDGNESEEQAEQFSQNWQTSLNQLKEYVES